MIHASDVNAVGFSGLLKATAIEPCWMPADGHPLPLEELDRLLVRGRAVELLRTRNLVTEMGRSIFSRLFGFAVNAPSVSNATGSHTVGVTAIEDLRPTTMKFGDIASPTAPSSGNLDLEGPVVYETTILLTSYSNYSTVAFSGVIPAGVLAGALLTEEGVFVANGEMFARTTFSHVVPVGKAVQYDHAFNVKVGT